MAQDYSGWHGLGVSYISVENFFHGFRCIRRLYEKTVARGFIGRSAGDRTLDRREAG